MAEPDADSRTVELSELRQSLDNVVREVALTGREAIITDSGEEVAVLISISDYERLHTHADAAEALQLRKRLAQPVTVEHEGEQATCNCFPDVKNWRKASTGSMAAWSQFADTHGIPYPPGSLRSRVATEVQKWLDRREQRLAVRGREMSDAELDEWIRRTDDDVYVVLQEHLDTEAGLEAIKNRRAKISAAMEVVLEESGEALRRLADS